MADVSHELGSLRFVVDSPLSSKVAMFNNQAQQHKQGQLLNPFSNDSRASSPKPSFSKDEYGKPLAGSLTEMRGQKANMHVLREMLELCQIISSEGYEVRDEPTMRVIPFGELFNIYNYISDKVVGILLRARKHKLVEFEGEMLFQRRDDDVPIFLLRPVSEIRKELNEKIDQIKRGSSPAPVATSLLLDKGAHQQKLQEAGLSLPSPRNSVSRTATPANSKAATPATSKASSPAPEDRQSKATAAVHLAAGPTIPAAIPEIVTENKVEEEQTAEAATVNAKPTTVFEPATVLAAAPEPVATTAELKQESSAQTLEQAADVLANTLVAATQAEAQTETQQSPAELPPLTDTTAADSKIDINNNNSAPNAEQLPTIIIEASAEYVRNADGTTTTTQSNENANDNATPVNATDAAVAQTENVAA